MADKYKYRENILKIFPSQNKVNGIAIEYWNPEISSIDSLHINGLHLDLNPLDAIIAIPGSAVIFFTESMIFINSPVGDINTSITKDSLALKPYSNSINGFSFSIWNFDFMSGKDNFNKNINGVDVNLTITFNGFVNGLSISTLGSPYKLLNGCIISGLFTYGEVMNGVSISIFRNYATIGRGLQIGLINVSDNYKGIQIGLWNKNNRGSLPFINWNF